MKKYKYILYFLTDFLFFFALQPARKTEVTVCKLTEHIRQITPIKFSGSYLAISPVHFNLRFKNSSIQLNSALGDKRNN